MAPSGPYIRFISVIFVMGYPCVILNSFLYEYDPVTLHCFRKTQILSKLLRVAAKWTFEKCLLQVIA